MQVVLELDVPAKTLTSCAWKKPLKEPANLDVDGESKIENTQAQTYVLQGNACTPGARIVHRIVSLGTLMARYRCPTTVAIFEVEVANVVAPQQYDLRIWMPLFHVYAMLLSLCLTTHDL